jgi:D-alanine transfer protein
MKRKLWLIFGPVVCACVLVFGTLLMPLHFGKPAPKKLAAAAVSLNQDVLLGGTIKNHAVGADYVPFIGSSELSRMDPFHPSVLAAKYGGYKTLLLGGPGTQSLTQFVDNQSMFKRLRNRKIVFIISPQWFTPGGQRRDAFAYYYSPMQLTSWLLGKRGGAADRYAARRILQMGNTSGTVRQGLLSVAAGQKLPQWQRHLLKAHLQILHNEDGLFSRFASVSKNATRISKAEKKLPASATDAQLDKLAGKMGAHASRGNDFGISDKFFDSRLRGKKIVRLQGSQASFDYRRSPEYSDFQLLLRNFAQNNITVQFVIPPVNAKWAAYTGLRDDMLTQTVSKIKHQLSAQGFNHVLDMSRDGKKASYMEDTIHLGWRGWVDVDKTVRPFIKQKQATPHYHISNYYLTRSWQQHVGE